MAIPGETAPNPAPATPPGVERRSRTRTEGAPDQAYVRTEDLEPHAGLRYIARLFKILAILLVILLLAEVIITLVRQGADALPVLLVEATRLIVFAALLWGAADFALMQIESNHDLRATRILLGRMNGKLQRMVDIEADELEILAGNPSLLRRDRSPDRAPPSDGPTG